MAYVTATAQLATDISAVLNSTIRPHKVALQLSKRTALQTAKIPSEIAAVAARPFVKWAGGKRQLLSELLQRTPSSFQRYHEPFLGGGALFFALASRGLLRPGGARLSDINAELINAYQVVRDRVETLIVLLGGFRNESDFYYEMRAKDPRTLDPIQRAARLLYLNKTCFNGLFRENRRGDFNVPFGRYACPQICNANELRAASQALRGVAIECVGFAEAAAAVRPGDFVYCDPPYAPVSRTASFVSYSSGGFGDAEQTQLAELAAALGARGANVLLSNSAVPLTTALYRDFFVEQVQASRAINSRGDRRGKVSELLIAAGPLAADLMQRQLGAAVERALPASRRRPAFAAADAPLI